MTKSVTTPCRCVQMSLTDTQMDLYGNLDKPANPRPVRCSHCTFPDLDFVARPYLLAKGISSPAETAMAEMGNFLVRERVQRILEAAVPEACAFFPTAEMKSRKPAPWCLAVPNRIIAMPGWKPTGPLCSKCGEPRDGYIYANPDTFLETMRQFDCTGVDVFKALTIGPCGTVEESLRRTNMHREASDLPPFTWTDFDIDEPPHPERWTRAGFHRYLYFSVRLWLLFKKTKVRGQLVPSDTYGEPTPNDKAWVEQKLTLLAERGLIDAAKSGGGKAADETRKWFRQFLRRNAKKGIEKGDAAAVETEHKLALPQDYKDFISTVGPKSFQDINETEGFVANVLPLEKLDFRDYRRGRLQGLDEESAEVDGVMFADTDHGDCFVFDVSAKGDNYPVFWFDHESSCLEPFAGSFAECIRRFAQKN